MRANSRKVSLLIAAAVMLLVASCAGRQPVHRYQIGAGSTLVLKQNHVPLELYSVTGLDPFRDTGLVYQSTAYRLDSYDFSRWAAPPTELVSRRLSLLIEASDDNAQARATPMLLSANISGFQEVDSTSGNSGLVEIDFCLRPRRPSAPPTWCKTFRSQTPTSADTREAAVEAISKSFNEVIAELVAELDTQLASDATTNRLADQ